jgi:DNA mismatch repair protein MutL
MPSSFSTLRNTQEGSWEHKQDNAYARLRGSQPQFFFEGNNNEETQVTPLFEQGENLNTHRSFENESTSSGKIPEYLVEQAKLSLSDADTVPILGRYIVVGFMDEVWVVDQHAAAERVRYEQFKRAYLDGEKLSQQHLLVPMAIPISEEEKTVLAKHLSVLIRLGFDAKIDGTQLVVSSIPTYLQKANIESLLQDTITEFVEHDDLFLSPVIEDFSSEKNLSLIIATMACHNSVRMNERLSGQEAKSIIKSLLECKVPYACPHGRRIVWRLSKEEVDRQFMR